MSPAYLVASLVGTAAVMAWRVRETLRPISVPRIVIPPLGMSTGFAMFLFPQTRIPLAWAAVAFLLGALVFSWPLLRVSRLTVRGTEVFLERSTAFLWILVGLVAVRVALRGWVEQYVDPLQTGALFYVLAFGMILRWRVSMLRDYHRLRAAMAPAA